MAKFQKSVMGRNIAYEPTDDDCVCEEIVDKLMHIITWAFNDGFSFSTNHIDTDIAVNICLVLRIGSSPGRAATRIAALMRALLRSGMKLRAQYPRDRVGDALFYEAVTQDIQENGVSGSGLLPLQHSIVALSSATSKTMLQLFVGARESFIRECPFDNEEGIYTDRTEQLLGLVDRYMDYAKGHDGH